MAGRKDEQYAAPVIIHLLNRRRIVIVRWGAMHLLQEVIKQKKKRIQIEQWLLLLVRIVLPLAAQGMVAVAIFVIVFAWNEFVFAMVFTTTHAKTAPIAIAEMLNSVQVLSRERARKQGIEVFLRTLADRMRAISKVTELVVPYDRGDVIAAVHREGEVVSTFHTDEGVRVRARLSEASAGRLAEFVVPG